MEPPKKIKFKDRVRAEMYPTFNKDFYDVRGDATFDVSDNVSINVGGGFGKSIKYGDNWSDYNVSATVKIPIAKKKKH
jgi:hypothetical protein